jgi:DNA-binding SARP family transcriptional activator
MTAHDPFAMPIELELLGDLQLSIDGVNVTHMPGASNKVIPSNALLILAVLVLNKGKMGRAALANVLFPDTDEVNKSRYLTQRKNELNKVLGHYRHILDSEYQGEFSLRLDMVRADVLAWDRDIKSHNPAVYMPAIAAHRPLLPAQKQPHIVRERNNRLLEYKKATMRGLEHLIKDQDWPAALELCNAWRAADPDDEEALREMLCCLTQLKRFPEAEHAYQNWVKYCSRHLNCEPSPGAQEMLQKIIRNEVIAPRRTAGTGPEPSGIRPARGVPVPAPMSQIIGRETDIDAVCGYLRNQ